MSEFWIGILILFGAIFAYNYFIESKWTKKYQIAIGKYYKLSANDSTGKNSFSGTCYFDDMAEPLNVGLRFGKGEKAYAYFENLNLMEEKRTGGFGFGGIFFRKKVAPSIFLRGGIGKFGLSKSLQPVATGNLYITNKGMFFDGNKKNIKLKWEKIMRESVDSNGIQIEKQNGAPIIFQGAINPDQAANMTLIGQLYESL